MIFHWPAQSLGRYSHTNGLTPEAAYRYFFVAAQAQAGETFTVNAADSILAADLNAIVLFKFIGEGGQLGDILAKSLFKRTGDGQSMSDSAVSNLIRSLGLSDTQSPADGVQKTLFSSMQEGQSGGDGLAKTLLKFLSSESQQMTDSLVSTILKSIGASDNVSVGESFGKTLFKVVLDSIDQDDNLQKTLLKIAGDGFLITDSAALAKVITLALADSVLSADSIARIFLKGIPEDVNASDLLSKILLKVLSDTEIIMDSTTLTTVVAGGAAPVFIDSILSAVREVSGRTAGIADPSRRVDAIVDGVRRIVKERGFKR